MLASIVTDSLQRFRSKKYWIACTKINQNQDPILCKASVTHLNLYITRRPSDASVSGGCCIGLWEVINADLIIHLFTETPPDFVLAGPNDKTSSQVTVEVVKFNTVQKHKQSTGRKLGDLGSYCGL